MLDAPRHKQQDDAITIAARISMLFTGILIILLVWAMWSHNIFDAYGLAPHGYCFLWNTHLVTLHVVSDMLIGLAYVAISGTLIYFVSTLYRDLPFRWVFIDFGGFIIACGITHFLEVWTLWYANYWLSGTIKLVTAIASITTAIILPPLLPKVRLLIESAKTSEERKRQLENAHSELEVLYQKAQELNQFKARFFANITHELRTSLTLILGSVYTLVAEESTPDLEAIRHNTLTLLKYINDLLDVTKVEAGKASINYSQVDIALLLRVSFAHFERLAQRRQVSVNWEGPSSLIVAGEPEKLQRVFLNLLSNAFKFTPIGGYIRCTLAQIDDTATVSIQDNGPGIPAELRETIFEPFRQVENRTGNVGGIGLGLAIVKEFIELHHGTISISESPGGGACFTMQLPLHTPPGVSHAMNTDAVETLPEELYQTHMEPLLEPEYLPTEAEVQALHERPLILIIEDNPDISRYITRLLATKYQTMVAFDGKEGLAKVQETKPDLVLCDIMMPQMSGDQFIREMRTLPGLQAIPLIVLSAQADDAMRMQLLQEGAQDYLAKPFLPEELYARIANLLAMKETRQVLQQALASQSQDIVSLSNEMIMRKNELEVTNEQFIQMSKLQSDFISMVGHEFRTTLTSIQGFSELLQSEEFSAAEVKEYASDIHNDAMRLNRMITELLDLERMKAGKMVMHMEHVDLNALLTDMVEKMLMTTSPDHLIHLQLDPTLPFVDGDRDKLTQVMINLLSNALKYSPAGGDILVRSRLEEDVAHISVQDHGLGISSESIGKLFTAYSRVDSANTRYIKGTGLGLAIVRQISEMHGGRVWAESTEGQGSTFHVTLPLKKGGVLEEH